MGRSLAEEKGRFEKALNAEAQKAVDRYESSTHRKLSQELRISHTNIVKAIIYDKLVNILKVKGG